MSQVKYVKILLFFFIFIISFQAEAKRKKKKKQKTKIEKVTKNNIVPTPADSNVVKSTINTGVSMSKQNEEIKPFAQIVVSFSSMGAGINAKARQAFLDHVAWFNTENHCELMYDRKTWGREGEVDYCFVGNNQILMPILYKQLKEKFNGERLVFVKENFPCK